jgi:phenylpropionate dioxygenase-like ring-hydroxylating dioxygenase large terminal subunit
MPHPGDILLFDELGYSVIVVRGLDGGLRAFLNMCPHRGMRLIEAQAPRATTRRMAIVCPFHAWCFELEGSLAAMPGREGFSGHLGTAVDPGARGGSARVAETA